ncbi:hypothetical protein Csp2054_15860 [Curtobacterium sp. 'Ferrero']|uniref:glycosyltransferase family 39 protein n=1 Tax=Curtobacterium sp. 'Ferrero' TaxID=2033654 RepID=UPI000BCC6E48|nr:glycosyltransferase family 39 protein [Curtobacterium sp. 'Ferrero']PCN46705.1 hypothetical protein Csp2054_15860 [Curtobacterium sp. 'Ferrero']
MSPTGRPSVRWRLPTLLGLLGTLVAATGSWIPSLWGDEGTSVLSAQRSWPSLLRMVQHVDAVHAVYYAALHLWVDCFGASPSSVRFPSAIAAGAATAAVVVLVRELADARLALLAGVLCCTLPRITYAGEEARSYAASAALAGWTLWVLVRLVTGRSHGRRWWVAYAALVTVSVWLFLFSALLIAVHLVVVVAARPGRRFATRWAATVAVVLVLVAPIAVAGAAERGQIAFLAHRTTVTFRSVTVGLWFSDTWYAVVAWGLVVVAVAVAVARWRSRPRDAGRPVAGRPDGGRVDTGAGTRTLPSVSLTVLAAAWLLVPLVLLLAADAVHPVFSGRYLTSSAPAAAVLMALGIRHLGAAARRPAATAVVGAVLVTALAAPVWAQQRGPYAKNDSDWAVISATVGAHARPGDAIVFDEGTRPSRDPRLALHTYPEGFRAVRDVTLETPYQERDTWRDAAWTPAEAAARGRFSGVTRVWLVEYAIDGRADRYGGADLERLGFHAVRVFRGHRSTITGYERAG